MWTPVGKASHIHVAVGTDNFVMTLRVAQQFESTVGDHLVGVHVDGCSSAALNRIDDELIVKRSSDDVVCCQRDSIGDPGFEMAGVPVGERRRLLHDAHGADKRRVNSIPGDGEILRAAQSLNAIVRVHRHLAVAQEIVLHTELVRCHSLLSFCRACRRCRLPLTHRMNSIQGTPITRNTTKKITPKIAPNRQ